MPTIKPAKAQKAFAIKSPHDVILPDTVSLYAAGAKMKVTGTATPADGRAAWKGWHKNGWRCIPVTVSPLKKKGRGK